MNLPMRPRDLCLALLVIVVWGLNFAVIKVGLNGVPPMLLGALLLLLADTLGRSAFQPREIPVGIVISVLSAPYFLFLLRRYF